MMTGLRIAVLCTLFAAFPAANAEEFGRQTWQSENGIPQNTVHTILQSRDGYLWAGTEGGLARFDGGRFAVYNAQNTPELRSNNIRKLLESADGSLWIATANGITRYKNGRFQAFDMGNVWSLSEDGSGTLWAVTASGVAHLSGNRFQAITFSDPSIRLTGAIAADAHGGLWIGTRTGMRLFSNGAFVDVPQQSRLPKQQVDELFFDKAGAAWIGTPHGLYVWNHGALKSYTTRDGLPADRITALYQGPEGAVWVGTEAGLARIVNNQVLPLAGDNAFRGEMILALASDREGDVWIGTESGGLSVLRAEKFTTFTTRDGLPDDNVRCVFQDRSGAVWIGTDAHGLARYQDGKFSTLTTRDGLTSDVILALAEDTDGSLLAGTPDGLNRIRNGTVSSITSADGLPDDFVRSIASGDDGSLWIGTRRGLAHLKNGRFTNYSEADGLGSDLIGAMLPEPGNGLWIATLRGLTHLQNGKLTNYTTENGLSSNVITALYRDRQGVLWIGTQGGGLNAFYNGRFVRFLSGLELPDVIYGLAEDPDRNLWISSNTGMFCASRKELLGLARRESDDVTVTSYGTSDGLRISESSGGGHPTIWEARDGSLWFATLKGVAVMRGPHARFNRIAPPVAIESVSVDDQIADPGRLASIRPGHSRFSFEYAGMSFMAPQKVRFRYKLEGFDRAWVDAGTRRIAYYTNLGPGRYIFRVSARNNDGLWNETGASIAFRVEPHFYQTYWFYLLVLAGCALLAWRIYRWRVRQVEAQFNAVLEERNRIAREIHDTLAQGFAGVSVQLELVARLLASSADAAREHLDQARVLVRNSLAEARRSIWDLRSQSADDPDFAARISRMAIQVANPGHAQVKLQVRGTYRPLAPKVEEELLKIAQEAVTNCVRHADAEHINIELMFEAKKLRMTIADDGRGFTDPLGCAGPDGHFGLQGMRERAETIDAELKVQTAAGKGTKIWVETAVN